MDKGIRPFARNLFAQQNELRRRSVAPFDGNKANTKFRAHIIATLMEEFGISLASAATHYNEAFKFLKELNAELVDGLGRAEDKKGGRKPKSASKPAPVLLLGWNGVLSAVAAADVAAEGTVAETVPAVKQEVAVAVLETLGAAPRTAAELYEELGAAMF